MPGDIRGFVITLCEGKPEFLEPLKPQHIGLFAPGPVHTSLLGHLGKGLASASFLGVRMY
jgi:hypothetical protein